MAVHTAAYLSIYKAHDKISVCLSVCSTDVRHISVCMRLPYGLVNDAASSHIFLFEIR